MSVRWLSLTYTTLFLQPSLSLLPASILLLTVSSLATLLETQALLALMLLILYTRWFLQRERVLAWAGAVISSIREGSGNREGARHATGHTILMLLLFSIPVTLLLLFFARPLCTVLGGAGETLNQAVLYLSVLSLAAPLQVMIVGCLPLIRNRGHVKYAMVASVVSGVINVIFDYVFVVALNWGTMGAGAATALAQCCSFLLIAAFFLRKNERLGLRHFKPNTELFAHSLKLGLAPFGLTLLPEITVVTLNVNALIYGGETAVAAYAVISYVAYVIQMLIQALPMAQPLVSQCYGAGKLKLVQKIRNTNFVVAISIGLIGLGIMTSLRYQIPSWFAPLKQQLKLSPSLFLSLHSPTCSSV